MERQETILVPLAEGFEEIEAVTIIDVLRRADLDVTVAGLAPGEVRGAHGISLAPDCCLDEVDEEHLLGLVLPGGMPGAQHLLEDERILHWIRALHARGRMTAAICAAPMVLAAAGILGDGPATSYPGFGDRLAGARVLASKRVVRSGSVVTSQGPGTALEFALALAADLAAPGTAARLAAEMLAPVPLDV